MKQVYVLAVAMIVAGCAATASLPGVPVAPTASTPIPAGPPAAPVAVAPTAVASTAPPTPSPTPTPRPITGLLVPLYESPGGPGWAALAALKRRHPSLPVTAIVNPDNGPPWGRAPDYEAGIAKLQGAGVEVVGYLSTNYAERVPAKVAADLTRWERQFPNLDGLFLDEVATDGAAAGFYATVVAQADKAGFPLTFGNAGTDPAPAIAALLDVVVTWEKPGLPGQAPANLPREQVAALAYDVPAFDGARARAAALGYSWFYVSEATIDQDPWGHLSRHAEALAAVLDPAKAKD